MPLDLQKGTYSEIARIATVGTANASLFLQGINLVLNDAHNRIAYTTLWFKHWKVKGSRGSKRRTRRRIRIRNYFFLPSFFLFPDIHTYKSNHTEYYNTLENKEYTKKRLMMNCLLVVKCFKKKVHTNLILDSIK